MKIRLSEQRLTLLIGLGLAAATFAAPLAAAEEADLAAAEEETDANPGIEEIVVLAGESESASDFAAGDSVTGFGAEDLAALGVQNIADVAAFTPNLEIVTSGSTTPTFFIRGVGLNDFNSNSTGAVAIYMDDVAINAPALQLSTLFDIEAVNVLRGPQGTGLARNASAGAIRIYSKKPSGEFGGFLRSDLGNFNRRDFQGALEAPIFKDLLAGRVAFRFTERDGTMRNRCGNAPAFADRTARPSSATLRQLGQTPNDAPWSICGEPVFSGVTAFPIPGFPSISTIPEGLPSHLNNINNWAARGTLLFQPTLDMTWLLNGHMARRDELSRVGQAIGTAGFSCLNGDVANCGLPGNGGTGVSRQKGLLGGTQGVLANGYQAPEIRARLEELAPCFAGAPLFPGSLNCFRPATPQLHGPANAAKVQVAQELAKGLDSKPWEGDFNLCGLQQPGGVFRDRDATGTRCKPEKGTTTNNIFGGYLRGEIALPFGMLLTSVTGYDTYDRLLDVDFDFSPETLFQIQTNDEGWQVTQDLRLEGSIGEEGAIRWDVGGLFLREQLDVLVTNDLGNFSAFAVGTREYTQDLWTAAGYGSLTFDFWDDFTLDGGFRFNWEQKKLDYELIQSGFLNPVLENLNTKWQAPTGTVRLTYRFREDTHVSWKYTRGWKPGTYNATSSAEQGVSIAKPETIDAYEASVSGNWLEGRASLDLSVFYYSYQDYQLFTAQQFVGGQPEFVILNAEKAEVYGAELDVVLRPWDGSYLNARVGWLESQFLDFVQIQQEVIFSNGAGLTINRELQNTGNSLLNSPHFKISLTGEQTLPLGRFGSLTARYVGVWTDVTFYDATEGRGLPNTAGDKFLPENTIAQPAFWVHNLNLTYLPASGSFEVTAWVRNLTNEAYKTFAFDGSTFNQTSIYFVGDPRTFGGSLTVNFF